MSTPLPMPVVRWANTAPGAQTDWMEFITEIPGVDLPVRYRLNLSWLLSKWQCQYGDCPGVLMHGAMTDTACCQIGVEFNGAQDYRRVRAAVQQLTSQDADNIQEIKRGRWYTKHTPDGLKTPKPLGTKVVDGACIFANRHGGTANKPGCALHHLAERTGQQKYDTKPDICWQIPMAVTWWHDEGAQNFVIQVDASTGALWGWPDNSRTDAIGYWCTETPDAYTGSLPVYLSWAKELSRLLGDDGYAPIKAKLDQLVHAPRRTKMPGEVTNGGRKMLPLLVMDRVKRWVSQAGPSTDQVASRHAFEALERSEDYLTGTRTGRTAANLLRSTQHR